MKTLSEKYRPQTLDQIIGQDKAVALVKRLLPRPHEALWIEGGSGTGKTSLAMAIAREKGAESVDLIHVESGKDLSTAMIDDLKFICRGAPFGKARVIVIDEAQGLSRHVKERLLGFIEDLAQHPNRQTWIIFTCMEQGGLFDGDESVAEMDKAMNRRVKLIKFVSRDLAKVFAEHAKQIAEAEGLDGKPIEAYIKLAQNCRNSLGLMIQMIDQGEMIK